MLKAAQAIKVFALSLQRAHIDGAINRDDLAFFKVALVGINARGS